MLSDFPKFWFPTYCLNMIFDILNWLPPHQFDKTPLPYFDKMDYEFNGDEDVSACPFGVPGVF